MNYLKASGEPFGALLMPDHPTLVSTITHSAEPVPFASMTAEENSTTATIPVSQNPLQKTPASIKNTPTN